MAHFDKAKNPAKPRKKWWILHTKNYSYYIWALPILPFVLLADYIKDRNYKRLVWDETIATKVLDKVLPQLVEWVEEDNAFYYSMEWSTSALWRRAPRKYRKWADKFAVKLQNFVAIGYENADYIKTTEKDNYGECWVKFVEKA